MTQIWAVVITWQVEGPDYTPKMPVWATSANTNLVLYCYYPNIYT